MASASPANSGTIHEQARARGPLRRRAPDQRTLDEALGLADLSVAVAQAGSTREVAEALLEAMDLAVPEADVALCLFDERAAEFELIGVRTREARSFDVRQRWPLAMASQARDTVLTGRLIDQDAEEYARRYPEVVAITGPMTFVRTIALPLRSGGRVLGSLGLNWSEAPDLDERAIAHLQQLADTGGLALGRARSDETVRRTRDLMAAMVGQMPLGVLIVEPRAVGDGRSAEESSSLRPLYMNEAFRELFGQAAGGGATTAGGSVTAGGPEDPEPRLLTLDGSPVAPGPLARAAYDGETVRDERYILQRTDGTRRFVSVNAGPVRGPDGRVLAGVATYADVTDRLEMEDAREAFLGILSHELRTPVTSIYGGAELLRRRLTDDEGSTELAHDLAEEAARLHRLVENLLVLSRVERGADLRRDDPVLVRHVVRRVMAIESPRWPGRRFELETDQDSAAVAGDEAYIELIVTNLLSNAAKYGPPDGVVHADVRREGDEVVLRVRDQGPGFDDGAEERAFELFFRSVTAQRVAPGAGIGLFAVKALAEAMGGRALARNLPGGGAEVMVTFRVLDAEDGFAPRRS